MIFQRDATKLTGPWEDARATFLEGLSEDEENQFNGATSDNIFHLESVAHTSYLKDDKLRAASKKLYPMLEAVEDYSRVLNMYGYSADLLVSPIWGAIKAVLYISQPLDKYFAKLLDMLCRVGRLLPRYGSWHEQFSRQETLRHALYTTFLELVHFCIDAKDAVSMIKKSLAGQGLSSKIVWDAFKGRYNAYLSKFSILGRQVQREANFAFVIHARSVCKANEARKRLLETTSKAEEQRKVLSLLPSVNYRSEHRRIQSRREEVSGTWLVRGRSFQTWLDNQASECFGCFGDIESERTELASVAIDYLAANFTGRNSALCYHYCDPTYPESMNPDVVIATLTHQLLEKTVVPAGLAQEIRELFEGEDASPDWEDISALLHAALGNFQKVMVVLDGVDQLDAKAQAAITSIFLELTYREDHIVKVLVFGRHQQSIVGKALYDCSRVEIPARKLEKDFVRCTVSRVDQKLEACLI